MKTLLREEYTRMVLNSAEDLLVTELEGIIKLVVKKAKAGDIQACKLLLARCIPAKRAIESFEKRDVNVKITITPSEPLQKDAAPAIEADYEDVSDKTH